MQAQSRDTFQVFDWIISRHAHEYFDVAGRPVGEGRSLAFQQVETEMRSCPYAGSRFHHAKPMNVSALRQMPDWQHVLTMLSWFGQRYRNMRQSGITTADDLAQVTSAGVFLVDFLALRKHRPLGSHEIPILISGLYKVCLGLQLAYLVERFAEETEAIPLPDGDGFLAYLEETELLIGEAEVCSGSPAMIMQAYNAIIGNNRVAEAALPLPCADLEIDWDRFDVFADASGAIWRDLAMYAIQLPGFCPRLADARLPSELQDRLNSLMEQRAHELFEGQKGLVVDIARIVQEFGGSSEPAEQTEPPEPEGSLSPPPAGSLAATVLGWLDGVAEPEMRTHGPVVANVLQAQLARYDAYETAVLDELNGHMARLMPALGLPPPAALEASALSHVCGRTLRDW